MQFWLMILGAVFWVGSLEAHTNYVGNRCHTRNPGPIVSKCRGRALPAHKLRNFDHSSHELQCTSNADHFFRLPQKFDFQQWNTEIQIDRHKAQQLRQAEQPDIRWEGRIPYQTIEVWKWEDCYRGTSSFECGDHSHERTYTVEVCSGSGENQQCHDETRTETYYEANDCDYDHPTWESLYCSDEKIEYDASFYRDPSWKPGMYIANEDMKGGIQKYDDALPNKYDLLPGESEVVQVFNTAKRSAVMVPDLVVQDAWNRYIPLFRVDGGSSSMQCVPDSNYRMSLQIVTERRLNKASPNAFKLPQDANGRSLPPISRWKSGENSLPTGALLMDSSSVFLLTMAQNSRRSSERQEALLENGQGKNADGLSEGQQAKNGFFKNTQLKVELLKRNRFWFDTTAGMSFKTSDAQSVVPSTLGYSRYKDLQLSEIWEVPLAPLYDRSGFKNWLTTTLLDPGHVFSGSEVRLRPHRTYILRMRMYQKGVPYYKQACEDDPDAGAACWGAVRAIGLGRQDRHVFSKPLDIEFYTRDDFDERNTWQQVVDFLDIPDYIISVRPPKSTKEKP